MFGKPRKTNQYRRKGRNLIATNKIKPEQWHISEAEAKEALKVKGYDVKQIKKIHRLKHQVCISYWDVKGNVCSSFFSYRIFARWQEEAKKLIYTCQTLKEWARLNYLMKYEFAYYHYPSEMEDALYAILENHLCVSKGTVHQVVLQEQLQFLVFSPGRSPQPPLKRLALIPSLKRRVREDQVLTDIGFYRVFNSKN